MMRMRGCSTRGKERLTWNSLLQATLPHGHVEDEVDTYEALLLGGRVNELSTKAPSLFDEDAEYPSRRMPALRSKILLCLLLFPK